MEKYTQADEARDRAKRIEMLGFDPYDPATFPESEENGLCCRHKHRSQEEYQSLIKRLSRIEGQIRGLKEMLTLPEEEAIIHVDGRRMWRVLENIYNNAAKYAMEGTRIYADLTVDAKTVTFNLKNVSEQPLNIDADELTERFIRGDVSRSTEGSGLGLSIAKSLTEMQGGTFTLYLDGDLFKVTITFPRVTKDGAPEGQGAAPEQ